MDARYVQCRDLETAKLTTDILDGPEDVSRALNLHPFAEPFDMQRSGSTFKRTDKVVATSGKADGGARIPHNGEDMGWRHMSTEDGRNSGRGSRAGCGHEGIEAVGRSSDRKEFEVEDGRIDRRGRCVQRRTDRIGERH